jgi:hypothetical protein
MPVQMRKDARAPGGPIDEATLTLLAQALEAQAQRQKPYRFWRRNRPEAGTKHEAIFLVYRSPSEVPRCATSVGTMFGLLLHMRRAGELHH